MRRSMPRSASTPCFAHRVASCAPPRARPAAAAGWFRRRSLEPHLVALGEARDDLHALVLHDADRNVRRLAVGRALAHHLLDVDLRRRRSAARSRARRARSPTISTTMSASPDMRGFSCCASGSVTSISTSKYVTFWMRCPSGAISRTTPANVRVRRRPRCGSAPAGRARRARPRSRRRGRCRCSVSVAGEREQQRAARHGGDGRDRAALFDGHVEHAPGQRRGHRRVAELGRERVERGARARRQRLRTLVARAAPRRASGRTWRRSSRARRCGRRRSSRSAARREPRARPPRPRAPATRAARARSRRAAGPA